jgi:cobalt-zinc-cadmium efflux system outer membrane protein
MTAVSLFSWALLGAAYAEPLDESDVLAVIDARHPALAAATQELVRASAERRQALGAWDIKLKGKVEDFAADDEFWNRSEFELSLPTRLYGARIETGYALGIGDLPGYYGEKKTAKPGEVYAGLALPLLRDGWVDPERVALTVANLEGEVAQAILDRAEVEVARDARMAWAKWVASGEKRRIAQELLRVAVDRDRALSERITAGDLPELTRLDNRRLILEREANLAEAESDLAAAAAVLALFVRDPNGIGRLPRAEELPSNPRLPSPASSDESEERVLARSLRPELRELEAQRRQIDAQRRVARNAVFPAVDVGAEVVQPLDAALPTELWLNLSLDTAVQQRKARGKLEELGAKGEALAQKQRLIEDKIDADVRKARASLEAARIAALKLDESADLAVQLVDAERTRFNLGDTDLLTVWIREQSAADAQKKSVDAWFEAWAARAALDATLGRRARELTANRAP